MEAYWIEQQERDVPSGDLWLSRNERLRSETIRIPKRLSDWRLGRWTAKLAIASVYSLDVELTTLATIEIRATESGAPEALLRDELVPFTISLSHSTGHALSVIAPPGASVGCDIEKIEARSSAFVEDYFTVDEQQAFLASPDDTKPLLANLIWSAKESALKALQVGLRADTRSVQVMIETQQPLRSTAQQWSTLAVRGYDARVLHGFWRQADSLIRTIVSTEPITRLVEIQPMCVPGQCSLNHSRECLAT